MCFTRGGEQQQRLHWNTLLHSQSRQTENTTPGLDGESLTSYLCVILVSGSLLILTTGWRGGVETDRQTDSERTGEPLHRLSESKEKVRDRTREIQRRRERKRR